jgi:hypothetical protein
MSKQLNGWESLDRTRRQAAVWLCPNDTGQAAYLGSGNAGGGVLKYKGDTYPFSVGGLETHFHF